MKLSLPVDTNQHWNLNYYCWFVLQTAVKPRVSFDFILTSFFWKSSKHCSRSSSNYYRILDMELNTSWWRSNGLQWNSLKMTRNMFRTKSYIKDVPVPRSVKLSPSDEARLGTLYDIRSRKRGSQAHLTGTTYNKDVSGLPEREWTESI